MALFLVYTVLRLLGRQADEPALQYLLLSCLFCLSVTLVRALNVVLLDVIFRYYTGRPAPSLLHVLVSVFAYAGLLPLIYSVVYHQSLTMEVLTTSAALTADIYAVEESEVLEIQKASLEPLFRHNAQLAEAFSQVIAERQVQLSAYTPRLHSAANALAQETILVRIKHYFRLGPPGANGQKAAVAPH
jgi:hypothetical protein